MKVHQAAIKDKHGNIHTLPKPNRHSDIIKYMYREGYRSSFTYDVQGFILEDGTFVDRKEAAKIALEQGQCSCTITVDKLTSEDLW